MPTLLWVTDSGSGTQSENVCGKGTLAEQIDWAISIGSESIISD